MVITVFGLIIKSLPDGEQMPQATLWGADEDNSQQSRWLVESLRQSEMLDVQPAEDEPAETAGGIRGRIEDGDAHHGLIIEPGYSMAISVGELPKVSMPHDPGRTMEHKMISIGLGQSFVLASEGKMWPAAMGKMMREAAWTTRRSRA